MTNERLVGYQEFNKVPGGFGERLVCFINIDCELSGFSVSQCHDSAELAIFIPRDMAQELIIYNHYFYVADFRNRGGQTTTNRTFNSISQMNGKLALAPVE